MLDLQIKVKGERPERRSSRNRISETERIASRRLEQTGSPAKN